VLSPVIVYHVMQGMDYTANGIYVMLAAAAVLDRLEAGRERPALLAAVLLGVALSSRLNFLLLLPTLLVPLARERGVELARRVGGAIAGGFLAVTLPFFLHDPAGFTPFHTVGLAVDVPGVPGSRLIAPLLAGSCALALSVRRGAYGTVAMIRVGFIVQLVLVGSSLALTAFEPGGAQMRYAHFAVLAMFFGLTGYGPRWVEEGLDRSHAADH
jgi:hypothetical protein